MPPTTSDVPDPHPHGPLAVLELTAWCALVLVTANAAVGFLLVLMSPVAGEGAAIHGITLAVVSVVAVLPVLVVGWPLGVLTVWLLRREPREGRHVLVFALVGAVAAVLLGGVGRTALPDAGLLALLAAEGALGAGAGRMLLGRARRARALRRAGAGLGVTAAVVA
ncbi:hypothetical protein [Cellulomonas wangsupingiae]|uniref:hypothetical protein n=1 Tax=Cellulomonas wangsupingiae TaxID=2968085 RepID=UPI001D0DE81F|nr:hypothetical protein [Cellulomonas wangsupingiae]MCM0640107.1 hypothetical protein [Cellulomonas wangsupingiae]